MFGEGIREARGDSEAEAEMKKLIWVGGWFALINLVFSLPTSSWVSSKRNYFPTDLATRLAKIKLLENTKSGFEVEFEIPGFQREKIEREGVVYDRLTLPTGGYLVEIGKPQLPTLVKYIEVPSEGDFEVKVVFADYEVLAGYNVYPAQEPWPDSQELPPFTIDHQFYQQDKFYPEEIVGEYAPGIMRDRKVTTLVLCPLQYNPARKELRVYRRVKVRVTFDQSIGFQRRAFSPSPTFENLFEEMILNYIPISPLPHIRRAPGQNQVVTSEKYLIITRSQFQNALQDFITWKRKKGLEVELKVYNQRPTSETVRNYIKARYNNNNTRPTYLLIVGDVEHIPTNYKRKHCLRSFGRGCHEEYLRVGTDFHYAQMDTNDRYPDIFYGRLSVDTVQQLNDVLEKIMYYEKGVNNNSAWVKRYLLGALSEARRFFISTSEAIKNLLNTNGFSGTRVYLMKGGWHDPDRFRPPTVYWEGDRRATDVVISAFNRGVGIVLHRDHGGSTNSPLRPREEGWGDPPFSTRDIDRLSNTNCYPIVFSINCQTGWFDGETDEDDYRTVVECFAEVMLRARRKGAVACIAASRVSFSGYNDELTKGFFTCLFPNYTPQYTNNKISRSPKLGAILSFGKMYMYQRYLEGGIVYNRKWSKRPYWGDLTIELFHLFGDPEMSVYTQIPSRLVVTTSASSLTTGRTNLGIRVKDTRGNPVRRALVCLLKGEEVRVVGRTDANGWVYLNVTPRTAGNIEITVTAHNYIPSEATIQVRQLTPPQIAVNPTQLSATLSPNQETTQTLRVSNTGQQTLNYRIQIEGGNVQQNTGNVENYRAEVVNFNWVDISSRGRRIQNACWHFDENLGPFNIGFSFPFYGRNFTQFRFCTNGWISFTNSSSGRWRPLNTLPSQAGNNNSGGSAPENLIAACLTALDDFASEEDYYDPDSAYYYSDGEKLIISWLNTTLWEDALNSKGKLSCQMILHRDGTIVFQYKDVDNRITNLPPTTYTIGIQNGTRNRGLKVNQRIRSNLAIRIVPVRGGSGGGERRWLTCQPQNGTIRGGQSQNVTLSYNATGLAGGRNYTAQLIITSNAQSNPRLTIPVVLTVRRDNNQQGPPPIISWTYGAGYALDGVEPNIGSSNIDYIFQVKYFSSQNNPPQNGYPRVKIYRDGQEIQGSPFVMQPARNDDTNYRDGKMYYYRQRFQNPSHSYSYRFEAKDNQGREAIGTPTKLQRGPIVVPRSLALTDLRWANPITPINNVPASLYSNMVVADLNNDGLQEIIVNQIYRQGNDGSWQRVNFPGQLSRCKTVADINGDGRLDIISAVGKNYIQIWLQGNGGNWTQAAHLNNTTQSLYKQVVGGDLNQDGKADILALKFGGRIEAWLQGENNTWQNKVNGFTTSRRPVNRAVIADTDEDGNPEIYLARWRNWEVWQLRGNSWQRLSHCRYNRLYDCYGLDVADVNRDGRSDVVVGDYIDGIEVYQMANGRWTSRSVSTAAAPFSLVLEDLNFDGQREVIAGNWAVERDGEYKIRFYSWSNNTRWDSYLVSNIASSCYQIEVADFTHCGQISIVARLDDGSIKIWHPPEGNDEDLIDGAESISLVPERPGAPDELTLFANYPNPFNPEAWLSFGLPKEGPVKIRIYNILGQLVRELDLGNKPAGYYTLKRNACYWDGRDSQGNCVSSGVYFYEIESNNEKRMRKMFLLK
jgi:hypothetical protein